MQNPLKYVLRRVNDYFETRREERFQRRMEEVKIEADRIISHGESIRAMHQSPEAWRLNHWY